MTGCGKWCWNNPQIGLAKVTGWWNHPVRPPSHVLPTWMHRPLERSHGQWFDRQVTRNVRMEIFAPIRSSSVFSTTRAYYSRSSVWHTNKHEVPVRLSFIILRTESMRGAAAYASRKKSCCNQRLEPPISESWTKCTYVVRITPIFSCSEYDLGCWSPRNERCWPTSIPNLCMQPIRNSMFGLLLPTVASCTLYFMTARSRLLRIFFLVQIFAVVWDIWRLFFIPGTRDISQPPVFGFFHHLNERSEPLDREGSQSGSCLILSSEITADSKDDLLSLSKG